MRHVICASILAALAGCAAAPEYGAADASAIKPLREAYFACLGAKAAIRGVEIELRTLAARVMKDCEPLLAPIDSHLATRGFSRAYRETFIGTLRDGAAAMLAALLVIESELPRGDL